MHFLDDRPGLSPLLFPSQSESAHYFHSGRSEFRPIISMTRRPVRGWIGGTNGFSCCMGISGLDLIFRYVILLIFIERIKIRGIRTTHANSPCQYQYVFCLGDASMFPFYYARCKQVKLFWDLLHVLILTAMKGCLACFSQPTRSLSFRAAISPPAGKTVTGHRSRLAIAMRSRSTGRRLAAWRHVITSLKFITLLNNSSFVMNAFIHPVCTSPSPRCSVCTEHLPPSQLEHFST